MDKKTTSVFIWDYYSLFLASDKLVKFSLIRGVLAKGSLNIPGMVKSLKKPAISARSHLC